MQKNNYARFSVFVSEGLYLHMYGFSLQIKHTQVVFKKVEKKLSAEHREKLGVFGKLWMVFGNFSEKPKTIDYCIFTEFIINSHST